VRGSGIEAEKVVDTRARAGSLILGCMSSRVPVHRVGRLAMRSIAGLLAGCASMPWPAPARQLDAEVFFKLQRGMNESELLVRAGEPDLVTYPGVSTRETIVGGSVTGDGRSSAYRRWRRGSVSEIKQYHYIPDRSEHDPHLTVVTLHGGIVTRIDRTKVFSRENLPEPPPAEPIKPAPSDTEIQRRRAERTLEAAQEYADTRSRLLEQAPGPEPEEAPAGVAAPRRRGVYRGLLDDGTVYYGDRPSGSHDEVLEKR
jgi:hypothetical protein